MDGAAIFFLLKIKHWCFVDYYRKFPIVKKAISLTADDLVKAAKIVFAEFGPAKKIIPNAGMSFPSDTFRQFCWQIDIEQAIASSYYH